MKVLHHTLPNIRSRSITALLAAALLPAAAFSQVTVLDEDITDSTYSYTLTNTELGSGSFTALISDDTSNISYNSTDGRAYASTGTTSAVLTLGWDFSGTDYEVTSFSIYDSTWLFNWAGSESNYPRPTEAVIEYSTDGGVSWTTLYTLNSTAPEGTTANPYTAGDNNTVTPTTITLSESATSIYYRITFTALDGSTFGSDLNQWGRVTYDTDKQFGITVNVSSVPEPATTAVAMGLLILLGTILRRRFRK